MTTEIPAAAARDSATLRDSGSGREGAEHWGLERATSAAALGLLIWLGLSLLRLPALDHQTVAEWLRQPLAAVPMLLLVFTAFWHLKMGLITIVDDYVHEEGSRMLWIAIISFASIFAGAVAAFAVLKIAFTGDAM